MGATGDYTVRLKMPDGYKVAPHWHPKRENVTVISGTLKFGMGDKFDESKMMSFPATSFAYLDPSMHHYAMSSGETVVQIHGMAPLKFNYIDPNDDPSKKTLIVRQCHPSKARDLGFCVAGENPDSSSRSLLGMTNV